MKKKTAVKSKKSSKTAKTVKRQRRVHEPATAPKHVPVPGDGEPQTANPSGLAAPTGDAAAVAATPCCEDGQHEPDCVNNPAANAPREPEFTPA